MTVPSSNKQWIVTGKDKDFDGLQTKDAKVEGLGDHDVLVKLRGASLNYRDLIIPKVSALRTPSRRPRDQHQMKYSHLSRAYTPSLPTSPSSPAPTGPAKSSPWAPR